MFIIGSFNHCFKKNVFLSSFGPHSCELQHTKYIKLTIGPTFKRFYNVLKKKKKRKERKKERKKKETKRKEPKRKINN